MFIGLGHWLLDKVVLLFGEGAKGPYCDTNRWGVATRNRGPYG